MEQRRWIGPRRATTGWLVVLIAVLGGCAAQTASTPDLLGFLAPGATTRADAMLRLGEPTGTYEGDRILTYRVAKDKAGYFLVGRAPSWGLARYTLVLVFDDQGVLRKHSLVAVRSL